MTAPSPSPTPWYRHRWPWLLMLGPVIVVVAGFATLWLAIATDDGLVADDYYKRGLMINRTLARTDRAAALQIAANVNVDESGRARVTVSAPGRDLTASPATVRLLITHPTRAGFDRRADVVRGPDGSYTGRVGPVTPGRWLVTVETDDWRLPAVVVNGAIRDVRLGIVGSQ
ncbi:MAG: FixH family protein [Aromatoleum sp.]|nr:FixH family protein [Aromatoleum sp.]